MRETIHNVRFTITLTDGTAKVCRSRYTDYAVSRRIRDMAEVGYLRLRDADADCLLVVPTASINYLEAVKGDEE